MHTCMARFKNDRPTERVQKSLQVDSRISPSSIQGNAVLAAMRSRMPWEEVINVVSKVTSKGVRTFTTRIFTTADINHPDIHHPDIYGWEGVGDARNVSNIKSSISKSCSSLHHFQIYCSCWRPQVIQTK